MRIRAGIAFAAISAALLSAACLPPMANAATKSEQKEYGEPRDDKALAYFIRSKRLLSGVVPMYLYAGDEFLGVLANNSYIYAYVDPGERFLWNDWERANRQFEFEPGKTYYFSAWAEILQIPEQQGLYLIENVKFYCSPSDEEIQTAKRHVAERAGKTEDFFESGADERGRFREVGEKHIAKWPRIDLAGYSILVIEDFKVTDPKVAKRKKRDLLMAAPARVANLVQAYLAPATFDEVRREALEQPIEAALILRVELTQYKPGSAIARGMIAGAGASRLDFTARLIDGGTGSELATFSDERAFAWGGQRGAEGGIDVIEKNLAYELATYLERQTGAGVAEQSEESAPAPD